jgi:hypothetical protein
MFPLSLLFAVLISTVNFQFDVFAKVRCTRSVRRHSNFWIGLYGECWVTGSEVCQDLVTELMRIRSNKRPFFQKGIRARTLIIATL